MLLEGLGSRGEIFTCVVLCLEDDIGQISDAGNHKVFTPCLLKILIGGAGIQLESKKY